MAGVIAPAKKRGKALVVAGYFGAASLGLAALYTLHEQNKNKVARQKKERGGKDAKGKGKRRGKKGSHEILAALLKGSVPSIAALTGLSCVRTVLANRLFSLQGDLFKTAFLRRKLDFVKCLGQNFVGCLLISYMQSQFSKMIQSLEMEWRSRLTKGLHNKYFGELNYYKCSHVDKSVENPEQRICEDVPKYCSGMAQCTGEVVSSFVDVLFYSQRLSSYTRTHAYTFAMCAYIVGAGTLVKVVSPNFARMYKKKQALEGSYRMAQSRLRSNSESVAFYEKGIEVEAKTIQDRLVSMLAHNSKLLFNTWKFSMVHDFGMKYAGATFAVILIIGPFFEGHLRPQDNTKGRAQMLSNMRYHTGIVVGLFTALGMLGSMPTKTSKLKAYAQRIQELKDVMKSQADSLALKDKQRQGSTLEKGASYKQALEHKGSSPPKPKSQVLSAAASLDKEGSIVFENATVSTPAGHVLIRDLNLVIKEGTNLLVTGPNGAGKSSLFRVLGGLWQLEKGLVVKPGKSTNDQNSSETDEGLASNIFYVPQKPYVSVGTLIEQLIYPSTLENDHQLVDNPKLLRDLLQQVDLLYLLNDFGRYTSNAADDIPSPSSDSSGAVETMSVDSNMMSYFDASSTVVNWSEVLSLGEQQRLGMARLFYHKPRFAILDECTSGVTNDMEERFCEIVAQMGCTCITISHRPALVAFHDKVLHLDGEGGWTLRDLEHDNAPNAKRQHSNSKNSSAVAKKRKTDSDSYTGDEEEEEEEGEIEEEDESSGGGEEEGEEKEFSRENSRKDDSEKVLEGMINTAKKETAKSKSSSMKKDESTDHLGSLLNEHMIKASNASSVSLPNVASTNNLAKANEVKSEKVSATKMLSLVQRLLFSQTKVKNKSPLQGNDNKLLSALAGCVVMRTVLSDRIANLNGQTVFYIINQDRSGFYKLMVISLFQSGASSVIASSLKYLTDKLALGWRERLTNQLLKLYFKKDTFYRSVHIQHLRDVDQRITRDVERWCDDLAALVPCAIKPVLDAAWYSSRVYKLTGTKGLALLYLYMIFGYTTLRAISPDLALASRGEHDLESAFRQSHIALRERAESVAFFGGGQREKQNIHNRFTALKKHVLGSLNKRFNHDFYESFLTNQLPNNVTWIISMVFSLQYPRSKLNMVNGQAGMVKDMRYLATVVAQTFTSFGDILGLHKRFTELAGGAARISEVFEEMKSSEKVDDYIHRHAASSSSTDVGPLRDERSGLIYSTASNKIEFRKALVETPSSGLTSESSCLAQNLSIQVRKGSSLLICGPNGSGKTSLMRCLAGLWPLQHGAVEVPLYSEKPQQPKRNTLAARRNATYRPALFFVTQKPYLTSGSLRAQVVYPLSVSQAVAQIKERLSKPGRSPAKSVANALSAREQAEQELDSQIASLLSQVRLDYLVERWGWDSSEVDWVNVLSLGEQQRLSMCRGFFHKPIFLALDECTNAVSVDVEENLYKFAKDLGITMLTITQRAGLIEFHEEELHLKDGRGSWQHYSIKH
jgi:ABC-type uncharacterized transport system fused permease/ATPase subunit